MEKDFDYQSVPYGFAHCYNSQCVQGSKCLRHLVAENCDTQYPTLSIINPNCIPADTKTCPHFRSTQKLHMAWGFKHLLDNVPYKDGSALRQQLVNHFGKTNYYRYYRQERPLLPKDQAYFKQALLQKGITDEPKFDRYSDEYYYG